MIALIKDVNWESRCRKKKTARSRCWRRNFISVTQAVFQRSKKYRGLNKCWIFHPHSNNCWLFWADAHAPLSGNGKKSVCSQSHESSADTQKVLEGSLFLLTLFFSSFCLCFSSSSDRRLSAFSRCSSSFLLRCSSWLSLRRRAFSSFSSHWAFFAAGDGGRRGDKKDTVRDDSKSVTS